MLRRPKPPSPRGPPKQHKGPAGHTQEAGTLPQPAPVHLRPQILPMTTQKIPAAPVTLFSIAVLLDFLAVLAEKVPSPNSNASVRASASARLK